MNSLSQRGSWLYKSALHHLAKRFISNSMCYGAPATYATPNTLLITCMDSRLSPSKILNLDPGSTFIIRNPGNFIPSSSMCKETGFSGMGELAALQLICTMPNIRQIVVGGHSDCKAIEGLHAIKCCNPAPNFDGPLSDWLLSCGEKTWRKYLGQTEGKTNQAHFNNLGLDGDDLVANIDHDDKLSIQDKISQINTLQQLENLCSHKNLREGIKEMKIRLNAIWYDVIEQELYIFNWKEQAFHRADGGAFQKMLET